MSEASEEGCQGGLWRYWGLPLQSFVGAGVLYLDQGSFKGGKIILDNLLTHG